MSDDEPRALKHSRSTPLPARAREGSFTEEHLILGGAEIPWGDVHHVSLGIVDQTVRDAQAAGGMMRKVVGKVMGKEDESKGGSHQKGKQVREVYLLDLYCEGYAQPFRLDSGSINYRMFLDEVGYVSMHNFFRFTVRLCRQLGAALFDESLVAFLARRRESVRHYGALYDFELDVAASMDREEAWTAQTEVDLTRDSWVEEWDGW